MNTDDNACGDPTGGGWDQAAQDAANSVLRAAVARKPADMVPGLDTLTERGIHYTLVATVQWFWEAKHTNPYLYAALIEDDVLARDGVMDPGWFAARLCAYVGKATHVRDISDEIPRLFAEAMQRGGVPGLAAAVVASAEAAGFIIRAAGPIAAERGYTLP